MAQRDVTKPVSQEEMLVAQKRLAEIRLEFGFTVGQPITYDLLQKALVWVNSRITYAYDSENYGKPDMWNTQVFWWLLVDDYLLDDCDGSGYVFIAFLLEVFKMHPKDVYRVMCKTETGGGHFVCWAKAEDGVLYQLENRIRQVRNLRYMHDFGYTYTHYSDMTRANIAKNKLFNAEARVMKEVYKVPMNAKGGEPLADAKTLLSSTAKSKTLTFGLFDKILTTTGGVLGTIAASGNWQIAGLVILYGIISLAVVYYIRGITSEPLEFKHD